jgi:IS30 family transposase
VSQAEVKRAVNKLNSRPRKKLGYKKPGELIDENRATLEA